MRRKKERFILKEPPIGTPYKRVGGRKVYYQRQDVAPSRFRWVMPRGQSKRQGKISDWNGKKYSF